MSSRKTSVLIDEDLLAEVKDILATRTVRETIDRAFREILKREARREEIEALSEMRGLDLEDPEMLKGAWRE